MELTEPRPCGATATKPASRPCTQCMTAAKRNSWHAPHISTRLEETNSSCIQKTEVRVEKQLPIFDLPRHLTENRKMDQANILIIGGGVVGCAIAHAVSQRRQDVFLVEQFPKLGMATSTRNSGVNHSGIYYPKNSLKARLCVEGNRLLYEFCAKHKVPFRHCGKLVIAADTHEEAELVALKKRGE